MAAAVLTGGVAYAQDTSSTTAAKAADDSVVVVITGVRGSLARSMKIKRNADSIVDGVSAEDMGKFPDANVAESLQRIPGVAIDRQGGEGRFVSINGLGPEFASVLVNGRTVANDNPDRSFSFDTIASELVSGVNVYKSANASIPEGGIGGTIDVITARPFDYPGFKFAGNVSGLYEENSGKTTPQASFIVSDRFLAAISAYWRRSRARSVTAGPIPSRTAPSSITSFSIRRLMPTSLTTVTRRGACRISVATSPMRSARAPAARCRCNTGRTISGCSPATICIQSST
ncbi:MAG: TonB-dependent receptor plug domain-containing protein [Asticcacaulis sp.]